MENLYHNTVGRLCKVSMLHRYHISVALTGLKIYRGQPQILEYLLAHGDCSQKELADHFKISPAAVATTLKKLESDGYIERNRCSDGKDSRINEISVTELGRTVAEDAEKYFRYVDKTTLDGFSDEEIETLISMLERMQDNLHKIEDCSSLS